MQFKEFFHQAIGGLGETAMIVLFKMLPRGAQIQKVRTEINRRWLKKYGRLTRLDIDPAARTICAVLDLKGDRECVQIQVSNYRLVQEPGQHLLFEPGTIAASREWVDALLKTLLQTKVIPNRVELKNPLLQAVARSIL